MPKRLLGWSPNPAGADTGFAQGSFSGRVPLASLTSVRAARPAGRQRKSWGGIRAGRVSGLPHSWPTAEVLGRNGGQPDVSASGTPSPNPCQGLAPLDPPIVFSWSTGVAPRYPPANDGPDPQ